MSWRILVLEDDRALREALLWTLEENDYEAHGAANSREALELALRHQFQAAVADVRMEGPDGIACLAHLKSAVPRLACIVMTGYAGDDAPARALQVQVDDYLYKPFKSDDLLEALRRLQNRSQENALLKGLLKKLTGLFAEKPATPAEQSYVEAARHDAYRSFFVGIRSGKIDPLEGIQVYDLLEDADRRREELTQGPPAVALHKAYQSIAQLVGAVSRHQLPERQKVPGQVPAKAFQELYRRVRSGAVSPEQLKLAPALRQPDRVAQATDPELQSLKERVWGQA